MWIISVILIYELFLIIDSLELFFGLLIIAHFGDIRDNMIYLLKLEYFE